MPDILRAMAISGSILLGIFLVIVFVAYVTVRRGEAEMTADAKHHGHSSH